MSRHKFTRDCTDGPAIAPNYELWVDFEAEKDQIDVLAVEVIFNWNHDGARLIDARGYNKQAIEAMCREHLEGKQ